MNEDKGTRYRPAIWHIGIILTGIGMIDSGYQERCSVR
jgi:hypothetical protein